MENITHAVITIQACARGYLVRCTIRLWHQWATIVQATWRGYCERQNLAWLYCATTVIQATWQSYCTRRDRAQQVLLPAMWAEMDGSAQSATDQGCFQGAGPRTGSDHRCFQSCQPQVCSCCQSMNAELDRQLKVVMFVGSSPHTRHMCGHTLPTCEVHGEGRSVSGQAPQRAQQPCVHTRPPSPSRPPGEASGPSASSTAADGGRDAAGQLAGPQHAELPHHLRRPPRGPRCPVAQAQRHCWHGRPGRCAEVSLPRCGQQSSTTDYLSRRRPRDPERHQGSAGSCCGGRWPIELKKILFTFVYEKETAATTETTRIFQKMVHLPKM